MKIVVLLFFIINLSHAKTKCLFKTSPVIFVIKNSNYNNRDFIIETNCSEKIIKKISHTLAQSSGTINSRSISDKISITPNKIRVVQLNDYLKNENILSFQMQLDKTQNFGGKSVLLLNSIENIEVKCKECNQTGSKNLEIIHNKKQKYWVSLELKRIQTVFKIKKNIPSFFSDLSDAYIEKQNIAIGDNSNYFTDIQSLNFYKTNKQLFQGEYLKKTDISPVALVTPGKKAILLINNNNLKLKSVVIPKEIGHYGNFINVYNPKSNIPAKNQQS